MEKAAYINSVSAYLPNSPIANEDMEDYIGKIGGNPSRVRSIVLRQNGIKTRYYGLDKNQSLTHSNAELAKEAVCGLFENGSIPDDLTLLACGTSTPDQLLPSHASMVHGELANYPMEIFSSAGVCLTSLQALKICYSNILAGLHQKAVCVASELTSPALVSKFYDPEYEATHDNPECIDCPVLPVCGGGCPLDREIDQGVNKVACSFYKTHIDKILSQMKL